MKVRESAMPPEELWVTFFDPPEMLSRLRFDRPGNVAEFGCGYGTFTIAAARQATGTVHTFDIEPNMIGSTSLKAQQAGLTNVKAVLRDFASDGTGLSSASIDYVMLFNILHGVDPTVLVDEAYRVLRPGGLAGVVHWNPTGTPRGPDRSIRPRPDQCQEWLVQSGFEIILTPAALPPYHFGLVGRKPGATMARDTHS